MLNVTQVRVQENAVAQQDPILQEIVARLVSAADPEMVAVLHGQTEDIESFAAELARTIRFPREMMTIDLIGPSIGPHVGPGVYGAVILPKA